MSVARLFCFRPRPAVCGSSLSVLTILLVPLRKPALELCQLTNISEAPNASLETVCVLSLPESVRVGASLR